MHVRTLAESTLGLISLICVKPLVAVPSEHRISFRISDSRHAAVTPEESERRKMKAEPGYDLDKGGDAKQRRSFRRTPSLQFRLSFSASTAGAPPILLSRIPFAIQNKY